MRIVECINALEPGGAQRLLVDLSNELSDTDEVVVLTLKNRQERNESFYLSQISKKVQFMSLNLSDGFHFSYLINVYKTIKDLNPDVVHIHCIVHYFLFAILFYRQCCYVHTLHNKAEYSVAHYFEYVWRILVKLKLLHVVTISKTNRASFREYFHLACDTLIYNGRKQPEISDKFEMTSNFTEQLKKYPDDIVLLCIARNTWQKNIGMLISAVNKLVYSGEHLQLIIIGDYVSGEPGSQWIKQGGPAVHFIGIKDNIADYLCLCDAFCLPSLHEGMPITLIESLACRCIPVCTPCSGIIDTIWNRRTGFISRSFSEKDYIETIKDFLKNRNRINSEDLFRLYQSKFSIESCTLRYKRLFDFLLHKYKHD